MKKYLTVPCFFFFIYSTTVHNTLKHTKYLLLRFKQSAHNITNRSTFAAGQSRKTPSSIVDNNKSNNAARGFFVWIVVIAQ